MRGTKLHAKSEARAKAAIFAAHEELLSDPDLMEMVNSAIDKGKSAAYAWKKAVATHADRLAGLRNQLLAQRANDLRDVGLRVLAQLDRERMCKPREYLPEYDSDRRGSHAIGYGRAGSHARHGILHDPRRSDFACGHSGALDGHSGAGRH